MDNRVRKRNVPDYAIRQSPVPAPPNVSQKKGRNGRRCCKGSLILLLLLVAAYISSPFILRYSHVLQRELIYVNRVNIPMFANLSDPLGLGLRSSRHFFLEHKLSGCRIGVWQVLPQTYHQESIDDEDYPMFLSDGLPIVLYLHGNTGTRATHHRIGLYKFLSEEKNYHVITFDYKGFGDSDCLPSERGMMEDGLLVWEWIRGHAPSSKIYLWGHSLGSSATTYLTSNLTASGNSPNGILLDAPFTTIIDAASNHPFSILFWPVMGIFRDISLQHFHETHPSIDRLIDITCPILIMHGHLDYIVPYNLGYKMYEVAKETRKPGNGEVIFIDCGDTTHKTNYHSKKLIKALDTFISS